MDNAKAERCAYPPDAGRCALAPDAVSGAVLAVEAIARANGADNTAARAAREVVEAGRVRVVLAFHREDGTPLTDADLEALRAFAPPPVGVAERAPGLAMKRSAKKSARASKKRGA